MTVLIDDSDTELFLATKQLADLDDDDDKGIAEKREILFNTLLQKNRTIHIKYDDDYNLDISFPRKKILGLF